VPAIAVILGITIEFFGGLFLVIGFLVPIVSAFVVIYFLSIIAMKRTKDHAAYVAFGKPNFELEAFYVLLAMVLVFLGAGGASLDGVLGL
jgi:uncharacterized membrane protein YphA (DoxX/SURF4 family)